MRSTRVNVALLLLGGVFALGLLALAWTLGAGSSEAQQGAMQNCPQAGKWAISVWSGDDATDTGQALATCGAGAVDAAYYLDPQTQGWLRWFAGRPEVSNLDTLNDMQGVIALGSAGAPPPTATPAPTPIVFEKGDTDTSFHVDSASFRVAWTLEVYVMYGWTGATTVKIQVIPQGEATAVCSFEHNGSGSAAGDCDAGPGDFYVKVSRKGTFGYSITSWRVEITPL